MNSHPHTVTVGETYGDVAVSITLEFTDAAIGLGPLSTLGESLASPNNAIGRAVRDTLRKHLGTIPDNVNDAVAQPTLTIQPPAIGQPWPGQGGIYAGISRGENGEPDAHLIVATATLGRLKWADACTQAKTHTADGHTDFRAPTRAESALCYANLKAEFNELNDSWYWTSTQISASLAWMRHFYDGIQSWGNKFDTARVRPVRRFILQSFDPSKAPRHEEFESSAA